MLRLNPCIMLCTALAESWDESAAKFHINTLLSRNESTGFEAIKSLIV